LFRKRQSFVNLLEINFSQPEISIWYVIKGFWNCPKYQENLRIILDWVGAELNSLSLLYVRDIFLSGNYESFLHLYVTDIFLSGSYESFLNLYVRHILEWALWKLSKLIYDRHIFEWELEDILICRWHIMNGQVGIKKYQ
jgi:hypothetical protein